MKRQDLHNDIPYTRTMNIILHMTILLYTQRKSLPAAEGLEACDGWMDGWMGRMDVMDAWMYV